MSTKTMAMPFEPATMSSAQLAAVSFLARYSGRTHALYTFQLRQWFTWCETNALDPLTGIQRAHVELYIRDLSERELMDSSINTMMHAVRGYFRFAHIDGLIAADPAIYARLPKVTRDESRTQGLDRLELIGFLQVAQTLTVHHGALAYLLGINALRASEAAAVQIEDYADFLRGYRVLRLIGKGNKPATMPLTVPVLRVLETCRGQRTTGPLLLRPLSGNRSTAAMSIGWSPGSRKQPASGGTSAHTPCVTQRSPTPWTPASRCATRRSWRGTPTPAPPSTTTAPAATSTGAASTSSPPTSPASERPQNGFAQIDARFASVRQHRCGNAPLPPRWACS
ncbi:site-specific integrase [Allobranchiibius sp. GilTou38]|uniref:tyrosine-type recombinase/integrase n=1 Tax=Allobranchiibius sp. GilTou38 TaxID=2815210 RepID=UPI001AA0CB61|nr:site-specific integrase [Allobranchiibius sp. GilTou38]